MVVSRSLFNYFFLLFILFLIFSFVVSLGLLDQADIRMTNILQNVLPRSLDLLFSTLSIIGSAEITFILLLIILIYFFTKKDLSRFFITGGLFLLGSIMEVVGKILIVHPRPSEEYFRGVLNFSLPSNTLIETSYAYPSGHMFRITFVILILLLLIQRLSKKPRIYFQTLLFLFLVLMMVSRIYLGEHWLSDVVGGYLLGASFALLSSFKYKLANHP